MGPRFNLDGEVVGELLVLGVGSRQVGLLRTDPSGPGQIASIFKKKARRLKRSGARRCAV